MQAYAILFYKINHFRQFFHIMLPADTYRKTDTMLQILVE